VPIPIVLLDACVLYPAPLRDLLMHLSLVDVFHAKWTDAIHDEWMENLLKNRPDLKREQLERTRLLMNTHVRDAVVSGYEHLIPTLNLPDQDDRHVLAAAIHTKADIILTFNLTDFPDTVLNPLEIQAVHPDSLLLQLLTNKPEPFVLAAQRQRSQLLKPPKTLDEYLETLAAQGLVQTVAALHQYVSQL
jgi:predicted nucleic acid-binding protein